MTRRLAGTALNGLTEAAIDEVFVKMARDSDYQHSSIVLANQFEKSDWEAFESGATHEQPKTGTSKTRSRRAR